LNAFAMRFIGRDFVVVYSGILELAYKGSLDEVKFILAHELGHLKANHLKHRLIQFGLMLPFLGQACLRACEYTADRYGAYFSLNGALKGLILLAAGKELYRNVVLEEFLKQAEEERSFWISFAELLASHPHLTSRIQAIKDFVKTLKPSNSLSEVYNFESV